MIEQRQAARDEINKIEGEIANWVEPEIIE